MLKRPKLRFALCFALAMVVVVGGTLFWPVGSGTVASEAKAPELGDGPWLNTPRALRFDGDLAGRVTVLWFWRGGSINCIHAAEDVRRLAAEFAGEPVAIIGVHAAKFPGEGTVEAVAAAAERLGLEVPIVLDEGFSLGSAYGVEAWPHYVLVGADGKVVGAAMGEGQFERLEFHIREALEAGAEEGLLATGAMEVSASPREREGVLRFPSSVLAVGPRGEAPGRLFISDSGNGRVIEAAYPDAAGVSAVVRTLATGLHDPRGLALDAERNVLYVAERGGHRILRIDVESGEVGVLVGSGEQGHDREGGKAGEAQRLNSPVGLAVSADGEWLYVAMAGKHQVWRVETKTGTAAAFAGMGRENSVDGAGRGATFAQPWGLAFSEDGSTLYVADAESSSVREVDVATGEVRTIVGHSVRGVWENGLFEFGHVDGAFPEARLQHPRGLALIPAGAMGSAAERLLVADAFNHVIRRVDPAARTIERWIDKDLWLPGEVSEESLFAEPSDVCFVPADGRVFLADTNRHRIVLVEPDGTQKDVALMEHR